MCFLGPSRVMILIALAPRNWSTCAPKSGDAYALKSGAGTRVTTCKSSRRVSLMFRNSYGVTAKRQPDTTYQVPGMYDASTVVVRTAVRSAQTSPSQKLAPLASNQTPHLACSTIWFRTQLLPEPLRPESRYERYPRPYEKMQKKRRTKSGAPHRTAPHRIAAQTIVRTGGERRRPIKWSSTHPDGP